jgi:hypothetical protein
LGLLSLFLAKKQHLSPNTRVKAAMLLTVLLSAYWYITYTKRVIHNVILQGSTRKEVASKASSGNIQHRYEYDGFLLDYILTLSYDLPTKMKVDTIDEKQGHFSRYQAVERFGDTQRVTYMEGRH